MGIVNKMSECSLYYICEIMVKVTLTLAQHHLDIKIKTCCTVKVNRPFLSEFYILAFENKSYHCINDDPGLNLTNT